MDELFKETTTSWILIFLAAFIVGLSKAGIKGIDMMNITIMAIVFGGKTSTGIVLPLLCVADILAVSYYHRHAEWKHFWKLMPWIVVGIIIGVFVGNNLEEVYFRKVMACIIVLTVAILLWLEVKKVSSLPQNKFFVAGMGLVSGFATMLGNLAGAFSNIYFLATGMLRNNFIGTAAWIFLVINFFKLPFQIIFWKNITPASLYIDALLLPAMLLGFFVGVKIVARIKDSSYRRVVFVLTILGALLIFFK